MKCPKCDYLGFDTGDRCKNCGYDFSLSPAAPAPAEFDTDLFLHPLDDAAPASAGWDGTFDGARDVERAPASVSRFRTEGKLPLFSPGHDDSDEPLIKLPAAPRPPLAVRRTPELPRLRAVSKRVRPVEVEPVLEFAEASPAELDAGRIDRGCPGANRRASRLAVGTDRVERRRAAHRGGGHRSRVAECHRRHGGLSHRAHGWTADVWLDRTAACPTRGLF